MDKRPHISVLEEETSAMFSTKTLRVFVDATLGAGGHAKRILEEHPEIERFFGFDQDPDAIEIAKRTLLPWKDKVRFVRTNFVNAGSVLRKAGVDEVDGFFLTWEFPPCSWIKRIRGSVL